jgi:hypothetical protein
MTIGSCPAHKTGAGGADSGLTSEQLRVDEIDGTYVQSGWSTDSSTELDHVLDEIEADLTVIKAPVDVRRLSIDEFRCSNGLGKPGEQSHRETCRGAMSTAQKISIEIRIGDSHI